MTRNEYLNKLKERLSTLTIDERDEAINYYEDYFNEAGNDEKVMNELGTPDQLAEEIKARLSNSLTPKNSNVKNQDKKTEQHNDRDENCSDALYYEYEESSVKNLVIDLKASDTVIIKGNKFSVETRGIEESNFNCYLTKDGTLIINNTGVPKWNLFSHSQKVRLAPRILITLPENKVLDELTFRIGAGNCRSKDIFISSKKTSFNVDAGNLILGSVYGGVCTMHCGMGNLTLDGKVEGLTTIDCGMGSITLNLKGNPEDYSYDTKVGLGNFKFNNQKKSGFCQDMDMKRKQNHFSVNVGMGSVNIRMN